MVSTWKETFFKLILGLLWTASVAKAFSAEGPDMDISALQHRNAVKEFPIQINSRPKLVTSYLGSDSQGPEVELPLYAKIRTVKRYLDSYHPAYPMDSLRPWRGGEDGNVGKRDDSIYKNNFLGVRG